MDSSSILGLNRTGDIMENLYFLISILLIVLGVAGIFLPVLPGPVLVLAGIFLYSYLTDFAIVSIRLIILFGILVLITLIFDYFASFFTAKKFGVSKWGIMGMVLGGAIGLIIFNIIGLLVGQILGIAAGEFLSGKHWLSAVKSGGAGILGYFLSLMVKITAVGLMVSLFIIKVLWKS
jgi:uncharacterized protein